MTQGEEIREVHFEPGTPELKVYEGPARDIANEANEYFDLRRDAAISLATLIVEEETVLIEERIKTFTEEDNKFTALKKAATVLMPARNAFETAEAAEPFAALEVWHSMNKEQRAKATKIRETIANSGLKEYGVTQDSLRVVMTERDGKDVFTLVHTGNGVDIGNPKKEYDKTRSYRGVMSDKNDALFTVEVDGKKYDTREGMTDSVYDAKIEDARARNVTLPDSKQLSEETSDDWTWTMLTGEPLTAGGRVRIRRVSVGQVGGDIAGQDVGVRYLRVCPAVEIV